MLAAGCWRGRTLVWVVVLTATLAGACAERATSARSALPERAPIATTSTTVASTTTSAAPTTTAPPPPPTTTSTTRPHPTRTVSTQAWVPYSAVGAVVLHHPADRIEAIGFHQSARDGAQEQAPLPTAVPWFTMESRDRDTTARGAADIVVEPGREIRAPVTGTVIRAGTYTLYCDHVDQFAVIEPDARPGWEVKVLHVEGLVVSRGQRVEAGVTRLAAHARVLPFPSQVEEHTGLPPWPHVHVEVVDPTLPDRPTEPPCD
jgi:murein DD-endopeptidase MepM/ murein hydrolase activator NlpD